MGYPPRIGVVRADDLGAFFLHRGLTDAPKERSPSRRFIRNTPGD